MFFFFNHNLTQLYFFQYRIRNWSSLYRFPFDRIFETIYFPNVLSNNNKIYLKDAHSFIFSVLCVMCVYTFRYIEFMSLSVFSLTKSTYSHSTIKALTRTERNCIPHWYVYVCACVYSVLSPLSLVSEEIIYKLCEINWIIFSLSLSPSFVCNQIDSTFKYFNHFHPFVIQFSSTIFISHGVACQTSTYTCFVVFYRNIFFVSFFSFS